MQERITQQLADCLAERLSPSVIVFAKAKHMCMASRGVKQHEAETITAAVRGDFDEYPATRVEFYSALGR
jgi:GTP cyclohydrolase I